MPNKFIFIGAVLTLITSFSTPAYATAQSKCQHNWVDKNDKKFAADCADMAFSDDLKSRQTFAWMAFARANQLIKDSHNVSPTGRVPLWMAWATDSDTFEYFPTFKYKRVNRDDITTVTSKKVLAGMVSTSEPNSANEEVTRNAISYNYITKKAKLNTKYGVLKYINEGNRVDMPVGSVEIKASWLKVPPGGAPDGAMVFNFASGKYWWRGLHVMVKMKSLPKKNKDTDLFYTEEPSWFWTTFEFNQNPGIAHVRQNLITQRAPLDPSEIKTILTEAGIAGNGFEAYAPNGTQIRFTEIGNNNVPVILGHTNMEDFAGAPNTAQPSYWTSFNASCHSCHATAAINPDTQTFFPFTVPAGALNPQYNGTGKDGTSLYLGDGFIPLDFMWPIVFNAK